MPAHRALARSASPTAGELRDQFHHVNDIVPTIYEALGVEAPAVYRGYEQIPVSGVSMRYIVRRPGRRPATRRSSTSR